MLSLICYIMLQLKEKWIIYKEKVMLTGLEMKNWRGGFSYLNRANELHNYSCNPMLQNPQL